MKDVLQQIIDFLSKDSVFWYCALLGTGLFITQFLLNFFGGDGFEDSDGETDSENFTWLSKQSLAGSFMMFGWCGLTCTKEFALPEIYSVAIALLGGLITLLITGLIFRGAKKLHSSGTVFRIEDAIGKEAMVYQRIPKDGAGKISISLHNFTHEIDAVSSLQEELLSFTSVRIIEKVDEKTVRVTPIK